MPSVALSDVEPMTVTAFSTLLPGYAPGTGPVATDCEILDCNAAAAALYGYRSRADLIGRMLSDLRPEVETHNSQIRAVAALRQAHKMCNDFSWQCIHRPDGEPQWCQKSVVTIRPQGREMWITTLKPVDKPSGTVRALSPRDYGVSSAEVVRVCGNHTARSLRQVLQASDHLTPVQLLPTIIHENMQAHNLQGMNGAVVHAVARTWQRYLYWCGRCGWPWFGSAKRPVQCPNRAACGSETWWRP